MDNCLLDLIKEAKIQKFSLLRTKSQEAYGKFIEILLLSLFNLLYFFLKINRCNFYAQSETFTKLFGTQGCMFGTLDFSIGM